MVKPKTKPHDSIHPIAPDLQDYPTDWQGLTKREYFAAMAMQGIEASNIQNEQQDFMKVKDMITRAVDLADALIAELNKEPQ